MPAGGHVVAHPPTDRQTKVPRTKVNAMGNRHRRIASLLISLIAVSPMAMEYEATNEDTIEAAKKSTTQPPQKRNKEKEYKRAAPRVKPSEIRKTRWKRFRYEMNMKVGAGPEKSEEWKARKKGKGKAKWIPMKDMSIKTTESRAES